MAKQKALMICEKPKVKAKIEEVYRKHKNDLDYEMDIKAQRGHLVTTYMPDQLDESLKKWEWNTLPIYPEDYGGWKYSPIKEKKKGQNLTAEERLKEIKNALKSKDYDFVIHCGDADQEGELLVNLVLQYCNNKLPVKRFWQNDLTDKSILESLKNLKDDDNDPMLVHTMDAAVTRQHLDWVYGMNLSRAVSIQMGERANVGRVKTVLLGIVGQREEEIKNFVPQTTYGIKSLYTKQFEGTMINPANKADAKDEYASEDEKAGVVWFENKDDAEKMQNSLVKKVKVTQVNKKHTSSYSPKLFKLSTAQIAAGNNGYTPAETLDTIQQLYEATYMSYPRTDCEYISPNEDLKGILRSLKSIDEFTDVINGITDDDVSRVKGTKKWCNAKELESSGHSALIPTSEVPDLDELTSSQKFIYLMICRRFIAMFLKPLEQDVVEIIGDTVSEMNGERTKKTFRSTGKVTTDPGYTSFFKMSITDTELPEIKEGEILEVDEYKLVEKTTTCPKRFTEGDLVKVCENPARYLEDQSLKKLGKQLTIGTPATRADIIKSMAMDATQSAANGKKGADQFDVIKEGKRDVLVPSEHGQEMLDFLKGSKMLRVDLTGQWELYLQEIRNGEKSKDEIYKLLISQFEEMLEDMKAKPALPRKYKGEGGNNSSKNETLYDCPLCGSKLRKFDWGLACSNYKKGDPNSCNYILGKKQYNIELSEKQLKQLISKGKTEKVKYYSKNKNKTYDVYLVLKPDGTVRMEFPKFKKK